MELQEMESLLSGPADASELSRALAEVLEEQRTLKVSLARAAVVAEELRRRLDGQHSLPLPDHLDSRLREEIAGWLMQARPT